jgi:fused-like protein
VSALFDPDDKTRANAAGAIGNLVRNGGLLCSEMDSARAPSSLLQAALSDRDIQVRRIALFSLGNACVYASCRTQLFKEHKNFEGKLENMVASTNDDLVAKYIHRLIKKLQLPPQ